MSFTQMTIITMTDRKDMAIGNPPNMAIGNPKMMMTGKNHHQSIHRIMKTTSTSPQMSMNILKTQTTLTRKFMTKICSSCTMIRSMVIINIGTHSTSDANIPLQFQSYKFVQYKLNHLKLEFFTLQGDNLIPLSVKLLQRSAHIERKSQLSWTHALQFPWYTPHFYKESNLYSTGRRTSAIAWNRRN